MKVLLVGGGGREHALAWKLARSPALTALHAAPGNPGIARHASCVPIKAGAVDELVGFARSRGIDLTVVGPEAPLVAGLADALRSAGLAVFGPSKAAAAIEGSKAFAKDLMAKHGVPTAGYKTFRTKDEADAYCRTVPVPLVVKASGLAAGKGAFVCTTRDAAARATSAAIEFTTSLAYDDAKIVVEEFMEGEEASFFALSNGEDALELGIAQDHKRACDDDRGPNTGGMGAYSPAPVVDEGLAAEVMARIVRPTIRALAAEGRPYRGLLYAGLMITAEGPKVVEFNCRFGDPECQAVLMRLDEDLLPLLHASATGAPLPRRVRWSPNAAVCVVLASGGYPERYDTGFPIAGIPEAEALPGVVVFQAGTATRNGTLVTAGGRVLGVTATAPDVRSAAELAYRGVDRVCFERMHFRKDIARRAARPVRGAGEPGPGAAGRHGRPG